MVSQFKERNSFHSVAMTTASAPLHASSAELKSVTCLLTINNAKEGDGWESNDARLDHLFLGNGNGIRTALKREVRRSFAKVHPNL